MIQLHSAINMHINERCLLAGSSSLSIYIIIIILYTLMRWNFYVFYYIY